MDDEKKKHPLLDIEPNLCAMQASLLQLFDVWTELRGHAVDLLKMIEQNPEHVSPETMATPLRLIVEQAPGILEGIHKGNNGLQIMIDFLRDDDE